MTSRGHAAGKVSGLTDPGTRAPPPQGTRPPLPPRDATPHVASPARGTSPSSPECDPVLPPHLTDAEPGPSTSAEGKCGLRTRFRDSSLLTAPSTESHWRRVSFVFSTGVLCKHPGENETDEPGCRGSLQHVPFNRGRLLWLFQVTQLTKMWYRFKSAKKSARWQACTKQS